MTTREFIRWAMEQRWPVLDADLVGLALDEDSEEVEVRLLNPRLDNNGAGNVVVFDVE